MLSQNKLVSNRPLPSPTLSKKFAVVDWCYRKINPLTYTRSAGLAPPPGLGAHLNREAPL